MAQSIVQLRVDTSQATRALQNVHNQTGRLQNAFGGLKTALLGIGITALAKNTIMASANFGKLQQRLKLLTSGTGTYQQSLDLVREAQRKFGLSITDSMDAVANLTARLAPMGLGFQDIRDVMLGFNTAAILAGASSDEQRNAMIQLSQALGSGTLRGDEFNSIAEQMPTILKPVADILGVNVGQLRAMAAEGKITAPIVVEALKNISDESGDMLKQLMANDPTMVFKILGNELEALSIAVGDLLGPAVLDATRLLTQLVQSVTDFARSEAGQVTAVFLGIGAAIKGISVIVPLAVTAVSQFVAQAQAAAISSALASTGLKGMAAASFLAAGGITKATIATHAFKIALAQTGIGLLIIGLGFLATAFLQAHNAGKQFNTLLEEGSSADITAQIEATDAKIKSLKTSLENLRGKGGTQNKSRRLALGRELEEALEKTEELKVALADAEARELTLAFETQVKDLEKANASLAKRNILEKEITEEAKIRKDHELAIAEIEAQFEGDEAKKLKDLQDQNLAHKLNTLEIKKQQDATKELEKVMEDLGRTIAEGVSDALVDAVMGAKSLAEAANALLNDIGRQLLRLGINTALGAIFGGPFEKLASFAEGGRPPVGKMSLVGEKGPELFVPDSAGTIIPNNQLGTGNTGGNVVVNVAVDASGSSVEGEEEEGRQLGRLIAAAVQSEIVQQKRPGGLLA